MDQGARDMAALLNINYVWDAPEKRDVAEQIEIFNRAVNSGADAILLAASDPLAIASAVQDAKAIGVKIIYVDTPAYEAAVITLATQNYQAGRIAGERMIEGLETRGIQSGSIGIIGVSLVNLSTMNRESGFREIIERDGRYQLLDTKYTESDLPSSYEAARSFIQDNPDLAGLFGTSEDSTFGIGMAIQESNRNIVGIGFDITEDILELVRAGYIDLVLVQNPYTMGYLGMAEAMAALRGYDTGPDFLDTGVTLIDRYTPTRMLPRYLFNNIS